MSDEIINDNVAEINLVTLSAKLDLILEQLKIQDAYIKTQDFNIKLILDRNNKTISLLNNLPTRINPPTEISAAVIKEEAIPVFKEAAKQSAKLEPKFDQSGSRKKTQVQQKVSYPDGKGVILATVDIYDASDKVIKTTRTNAQGKWSLSMEAGHYKIHVHKPAASNKPFIEATFEVDITSSDTMELNEIK